MPVVERDGVAIHYQVRGRPEAPPLLLIMGLGFSSRAWGRLPARLEGRFRVIVFDNRGTGLSGRPNGFYSMSDLADDAAAVLTATGVSSWGGAFVFGVSMGGMIAQQLVLRHPQLVASMVLGATFASWVRSDKPAIDVGLKLLGVNLLGSRAAPLLVPLLVSPEFLSRNAAELNEWLRQTGLDDGAALVRQLGAIAQHSTVEHLSRIACPTLIVTGTADRIVPPANSRLLAARIPGARLVELPGAGHVFPLEREDETVELLESHFLGPPVEATRGGGRRRVRSVTR